MHSPDHYDIIIVGVGPAGISTVLHLAKIAPEIILCTLILEKAHHPRSKLCGGGILPDAEVIPQHLELDITEIPHCDIDWACFNFDDKGMKMRSGKKGTFAFRTIRRRKFDSWLAGKAHKRGFLIQENTTVRRVEVTDNEVVLETKRGKYHASVAVGADESKSTVRHAVNPREKELYSPFI